MITLSLAAAGIIDWWVNVYPESQRRPLEDGIWHAAAVGAAMGRDGCSRFGKPRALYVVHVRLRALR